MSWRGENQRHAMSARGIKTNGFELKPEERQDLNPIIELIKQHPAVIEIALFGSRARGTETEKSDYDILVFMNPNVYTSDVYDMAYFEDVFVGTHPMYDIKFIDDSPGYGTIMWVYDRGAWREQQEEMAGEEGYQGTPISSEIIRDLKSLWKRPRRNNNELAR